MKIAGLQKNSFVDYPGKIAAVVFTLGCNMDCYYCHNRGLLSCEQSQTELLDEIDVIDFLAERRKFLDGVVISGGEPTMQEGLGEFIQKIRDMGYSIKLDTNGTNPNVLERLFSDSLIDYVAMDIKAPFERYSELCRSDVNIENIQRSIELIMGEGLEYEFRTTFVPKLSYKDIEKMVKSIKGAKHYVLQQYRTPELASDDGLEIDSPYSSDYIYETADRICKGVVGFEVRGCVHGIGW